MSGNGATNLATKLSQAERKRGSRPWRRDASSQRSTPRFGSVARTLHIPIPPPTVRQCLQCPPDADHRLSPLLRQIKANWPCDGMVISWRCNSFASHEQNPRFGRSRSQKCRPATGHQRYDRKALPPGSRLNQLARHQHGAHWRRSDHRSPGSICRNFPVPAAAESSSELSVALRGITVRIGPGSAFCRRSSCEP
jgi:hypothetical protein